MVPVKGLGSDSLGSAGLGSTDLGLAGLGSDGLGSAGLGLSRLSVLVGHLFIWYGHLRFALFHL